jgi:hypothetical protein
LPDSGDREQQQFGLLLAAAGTLSGMIGDPPSQMAETPLPNSCLSFSSFAAGGSSRAKRAACPSCVMTA